MDKSVMLTGKIPWSKSWYSCMTMQTQVFVSSRNAPPAQMIDFKKLNYIRTAKTQKDLGQTFLLWKVLKINGQALLKVDFPELLDGVWLEMCGKNPWYWVLSWCKAVDKGILRKRIQSCAVVTKASVLVGLRSKFWCQLDAKHAVLCMAVPPSYINRCLPGL